MCVMDGVFFIITTHGGYKTTWNITSKDRKYFRTCKVCGRVFLAKSLKYSICSDKCRKVQGTQAKRDFDARAIENEYDHIYKNEAQRWVHYIHRMEKSDDCSPERLVEIKSVYESFKTEAKQRKKAVKEGKITLAEFRNWILWQLDGAINTPDT